MSEIINMVMSQLGGGGISKLSNLIGADEKSTEQGVKAALPALVGAVAKNSSEERGASSLLSALDRDHDGSVLDDVTGFFSQNDGQEAEQKGSGILSHLVGKKQDEVAAGVGKISGLSLGSSNKLMSMLAPLVMGALSKKVASTGNSSGLDLSSLTSLMGNEKSTLSSLMGSGGGQMASLLGGFLDKDGDGSVVDDLAKGFFSRLFSRKK